MLILHKYTRHQNCPRFRWMQPSDRSGVPISRFRLSLYPSNTALVKDISIDTLYGYTNVADSSCDGKINKWNLN